MKVIEDLERLLKSELLDFYGISEKDLKFYGVSIKLRSTSYPYDEEETSAHLEVYSNSYYTPKKLFFLEFSDFKTIENDGIISALLFIINKALKDEFKSLDEDVYSYRNIRFIA